MKPYKSDLTEFEESKIDDCYNKKLPKIFICLDDGTVHCHRFNFDSLTPEQQKKMYLTVMHMMARIYHQEEQK
tara:strand:- start:931 stop:1149 length:219 start_codon:yes stop_codon:yes gene_type:complete